MQCLGDGLAAHGIAVAVELEQFGAGVVAAAFPANPDSADRFVRGAAARACDAGDGYGHAGAGVHQGAGDHFRHAFAADRAVFFQGFRAHAEQCLFSLITVGDHAAVEPFGGAADAGGGFGNPAAGAAFGSDQHQVLVAQCRAGLAGELFKLAVSGDIHRAN